MQSRCRCGTGARCRYSFAKTERTIATGDVDGLIIFWDLYTGKLEKSCLLPPNPPDSAEKPVVHKVCRAHRRGAGTRARAAANARRWRMRLAIVGRSRRRWESRGARCARARSAAPILGEFQSPGRGARRRLLPEHRAFQFEAAPRLGSVCVGPRTQRGRRTRSAAAVRGLRLVHACRLCKRSVAPRRMPSRPSAN